MPPEAYPTPPPTRFECSTSSGRVRAGTEGWTTMKLVERAERLIGTKSRRTS
jgi:hypothetical protein